MLELDISAHEFYDEATNEFVTTKPAHLELEHSLISISKWESKWCKPFLTDDPKNHDEILSYIHCMTINKVDPKVYFLLTKADIDCVSKYIDAPMSATWFGKKSQKSNRAPSRIQQKVVTSEVIYYWMFSLSIPKECERWHINRLMTLIHVFEEKNKTANTKMSKQDILRRNKELNEARRAKYHTNG